MLIRILHKKCKILIFFDFFKKIWYNLKNESGCQLMILALDASTKSTGYAIFDKEKLIQYGYFTASSSDLLCRLDKMKKEII